MAVLYCENEMADRLAGLRKQSEEPVNESPNGVRIAVMHDIGVSTYGFRGQEDKLREWMDAYGFGSGGMLMVE